MATSASFPLVAFSLVLLLVLGFVVPEAESRAFFVFGDSLVDSGNNNYLATTARADSYPYGIDYPTHQATGRFSNGLNIPDLISEAMGEEPTMAYLNPQLRGQKLLVGANFASAGIGILNDTGVQFLNIIGIPRQFEYFEQYKQRVSAVIGPVQTQKLVNGALVLITAGGNDFVNNYYSVPLSARSRQFALPDFVTYVISEYKNILLRLYDLGARRVIVTGSGPLGCVPAMLAQRSTNGGCSEELQRATALFNPQLREMINQINREKTSDVFITANSDQMHQDFITNPEAFGFVTSKIACCGQGPYNGIGTCALVSNLCPNRSLYAFWDPFHPSEKANKIIVQQLMTGSTELMHPMNLSTILALDAKNYKAL